MLISMIWCATVNVVGGSVGHHLRVLLAPQWFIHRRDWREFSCCPQVARSHHLADGIAGAELLHSMRNGWSVTLAMGAANRLLLASA
jgi:hypothetical protein